MQYIQCVALNCYCNELRCKCLDRGAQRACPLSECLPTEKYIPKYLYPKVPNFIRFQWILSLFHVCLLHLRRPKADARRHQITLEKVKPQTDANSTVGEIHLAAVILGYVLSQQQEFLFANSHTASNTPDPVRTPKLSDARPG